MSTISSLISGITENEYSKHRDDPMDALGVDNDEFNSYIEQIAYTSPGDYIKIRHKIFAMLIRKVVKDMNKLIYDVMTKGTIDDESIIGDMKFSSQATKDIIKEMRATFNGDGFKPSVPRKETNNIAMSIVDNIRQNLATLVVDRIMNKNNLSQALGSAQRQADMNLGVNKL